MTELKACPFCGSKDVELRVREPEALVACNNCGCRTGLVFFGHSEASNAARTNELAAIWNTRASGGRVMGICVDRLAVAEEGGLFWAMDWVPSMGGHATVNRYHLAFKSKRDAEAFVRAAKRATVREHSA